MISFIQVFRTAYHDKNSIEEALAAIRNAGASQMDSVKIVMSELNLSLSEADELVLNSKTWEDSRSAVIDLRESIWTTLNEHESETLAQRIESDSGRMTAEKRIRLIRFILLIPILLGCMFISVFGLFGGNDYISSASAFRQQFTIRLTMVIILAGIIETALFYVTRSLNKKLVSNHFLIKQSLIEMVVILIGCFYALSQLHHPLH